MLINSLVIVAGLAVALMLSGFQVQRQYRQEFEHRLDTALSLLGMQSAQLQQAPQACVEQAGEALHSVGQEIRITLIDKNGRVLADNARQNIDENHAARPEVQQALQGGKGYAQRESDSTGTHYLYEAVRLRSGRVLRVALPIAEMERATRQLWEWALLCAMAGIVIVVLGTWLLVSHAMRPLQQLTTAAERISRGDFSSRVAVQGKDEVATLARSFNRMARNTDALLNELRNNQSRLKGLLEGMRDGVLAVDGGGKILFLNERVQNLMGCPGLRVGDSLETGLALSRVGKLLAQAKESGKPQQAEIAGLRAEQQFRVYASPLEDGKTLLAVVSDVSRVKKLEQMRSQFVSNVTHELKTPLTSIRASIDLLKDSKRDEETRAYFYEVLDMEAERLQRLIDDMLSLSRLESSKGDPNAKPCNLLAAVQASTRRLRLAAQRQQVQVRYKVDPQLYILCAPMRLEQLLSNLIENGIKYNRPGGTVEVLGASQQEIAVVQVRDTGIGIAPEHIPRLFERFYRVDASRSRAVGGTGLGLSICKHIVSLYGGDISVESRQGEGSTFTVRLPRCPQGAVPPEPPATQEGTNT